MLPTVATGEYGPPMPTPDGHEVVQTGAKGGGFLSEIGGILTTGVSRYVDIELADHAARTNADLYGYSTPPAAGAAPYPNDYEYGTAARAADVWNNLAPWQLAGLAIAGALAVALAAGKFR